MKRYIFVDNDVEIPVEATSIVDAFLTVLDMVMDGKAVHPMFSRVEEVSV